MYFWSTTKNFASPIAAMPEMRFSTPATSSRIPANTHQPVTLFPRYGVDPAGH
jgi:hypothetical protein